MISSFIPPPYSGLKIERTEAEVAAEAAAAGGAALSNDVSALSLDAAPSSSPSSSGSSPHLVSIELLLQSALSRASSSLVGEGNPAVYSLIETARDFMLAHASVLAKSLEAQEQADGNLLSPTSSARVLQLDSIQVFGRGRIEKLEAAAIAQVVSECDLPESNARAKLKENKWDAAEVVRKVREARAKEAGAANSSSLPSSAASLALLQPTRQDSTAERERFNAIQATFARFHDDPEATLSCAACCEDLQLREAFGQVCGHVMCRMVSALDSQ